MITIKFCSLGQYCAPPPHTTQIKIPGQHKQYHMILCSTQNSSYVNATSEKKITFPLPPRETIYPQSIH